MGDNLEKIVSRLEAVTAKLENLPQLKPAEEMNFVCTSNNQITLEYEDIIKVELKSFVGLSDKIGGDVAKHASLVQKAMNAQLDFIKKCTVHSKPSDSDLQALLKPTSEAIGEIVQFRESNRRSEFFNHLSAISEGIPALGWVTVSPAPCPYIKDMQDAGIFYTNRVIKEFKEKDASHVDWTKSWLAVLTKLQSFVKKNYTTGITWNNKPGSQPIKSGAPAPPTGPPAGPPPPPAPPAASSSGGDGKAALLNDLNKGASVTQGLRKVTDDQKTHKNPNLRAGNTVGPISVKTDSVIKAAPPIAKKPPSKKLEGCKWTVEYFSGQKDLVIEDTQLKETLVVYKCDNCVITVKGKINSIMLDNCKKTAIVFDGLISSLDLVNCTSIQAQTLGTLATINIDKTDGAQIYLNKESLHAEIISAKSSEMNVLIPDDNNDIKEMAIPEQFKTKIVDGKLVTTCTDN